jgi:xylulokinase
MENTYLIAYDIGTSGTKASLYTAGGKMIGNCTVGYDVFYGKRGVVEQDPEEWWKAVVRATHVLTSSINKVEVKALSFSGQMMGCLLVDKEGTALRNSLIWADTRSREEEKILKERVGEKRGYEILGHRLSCSYSIEKLMWIKAHEPDVYEHAYKMLQAKDFIIMKMTGRMLSDYSDGSGTNAMNLRKNAWSDEILEAAGVDKRLMPELVQSVEVAGTLTKEASEALGLPESVQVVVGGGDGPCATLGSGCIHDDQYYVTFGTSAWIAGTTDEPFTDKNEVLMTFSHVIPGKYGPTGTMQAAGSSYSYIKNTFCAEEAERAKAEGKSVYDILDEMVEKIPAGSDNLMYLPYPVGERSPRWNPDTTAAFLGISMAHTKAHYIRAVLEGVALNLNVILRAQRERTAINQLIFTGGGAKGDVLAQIMADVTGCRIIRPNHVEEATSMAAAVIAGVGSGVFEDFEAISKFLKFGKPVEPIPENRQVYEQSEKVFDDLYNALVPVYPELRDHGRA